MARWVSRSYSSNATITTASLPCRVTTWGACSLALRNTSLNCALAVCNCQRSGEGFRFAFEFEFLGAMPLTSLTRLIIRRSAFPVKVKVRRQPVPKVGAHYNKVVRVIARSTLTGFVRRPVDGRGGLNPHRLLSGSDMLKKIAG